MKIKLIIPLLILLIWSCKETPEPQKPVTSKVIPLDYLPFEKINLSNLSAFETVAGNWQLGGTVQADLSKEKTLLFENGSGILINIPDAEKKDNLFTSFEHGDIELEMEVMLASKSNSGIYLQGRYEVQLLDSWGVENAGPGDMGGIYQRWDESAEEGQKGYEGSPPAINAAKAPGLWQQLKLIFHAPEFNAAGDKIKNASFQEVWLNGVLIQKDIELTGPTRGSAFKAEGSSGPLMIQGDHGPVAFKNIKYKLYDNKKVRLSNIRIATYESPGGMFANLDSLQPIKEMTSDSISSKIIAAPRSQRLLKFDGIMELPSSGQYLFDLKLNVAGGALILDKDTIINMNGSYNLDSLGIATVPLKQGKIPFTLIYNKHLLWTIGFSLNVEGPQIQKYNLSAKGSLDLSNRRPSEDILVEVGTRPVLQRSFLMFKGEKRTHCISVGTPSKVNYSYDLESGALLQAWDQEFLDATEMWHGRGEKQLGNAIGFTIAFHGTADMAKLENTESPWPAANMADLQYTSEGYTLDQAGLPTFSYSLGQSHVNNKLVPMVGQRGLERAIKVDAASKVYHKLAAGEAIQDLGGGTYIINDESYYIQYPAAANLQPFVRDVDGMRELLLEIPAGEQQINYSIIW